MASNNSKKPDFSSQNRFLKLNKENNMDTCSSKKGFGSVSRFDIASRQRTNSKVSNRTRTTSVNDILANRGFGQGRSPQTHRKGAPVRSISRKGSAMKFSNKIGLADVPDLALRKSPKNAVGDGIRKSKEVQNLDKSEDKE